MKKCPICECEHKKVALECGIKCIIINRHEKNGECWNWTGKIINSGYGSLVQGVNGKKKYLSAHRESYKVFKGKIPLNMNVCHTCDNKKCINPEHLWIGTQKDNIRDCSKKGRKNTKLGPRISIQGEKHHRAKLTEKDVLKIRESLSLGSSQDDLAQNFGVSKKTIQAIYYKTNWKYLV